ncbi:MAG: restriction endonuclease subunit S [Polaromonas sp.]|uniref:restriction endonuclease subunit S n=1 Tax=Polaromonas sp. TaxID=1869339 RepID=UPI002726FAE3|nr:restriction endonuclease subunit S [Polaromonas sp.]MDO9115560.1 restriction endonuclease subunit S [Polaromonas sp.]MDP1885762.1 restriction endonuclease subunit S [Polaromonas sp.]
MSRATTWNPLRASPDDVFRYIDLSSVDQDAKTVVEAREVACGEAPSRARQLVSVGDVLVSTVRPNLNGVARVPSGLDGATASTGFCVLRPDPSKIDGGYLFQWVKSSAFVSDMVSKATGASYPAVSDRIIFESLVPLPLLEEQRRIAAILDQAETLRTQRRAAVAQLDSLTQSLFLEMFGDPVANTKKWVTQALQKVCDPINDCPHSTPDWTESGMRCLRTSNLTIGGWNWVDTRYVSESTFHDRSKRGYLVPGDIVLSREGTVGIAAIVQEGMELCMGQRLVQVRPVPSTLVPEYLLRHLLYVLSPSRISQLMVGSTSQHLNVKELRALRIPTPPLALQQIFATRIQSIEALKATHRAALAELDALFASLQQRAFSGELTQSIRVLHTKARDFSELCKLDADKGLEALIYVAKRMPEHHFYKALKALYFADKHQLEHQGRLIYGETHCALPMGPVPQAAYDAAKVLSGELLVSAFDDEALRASLRRTDKELIPLRDADPAKLSAEERESLDWAIRYVAPMSFDQVKTASHDSAYEHTPRNQPIQLEHIVEMLPEAAQRKFFSRP